MGLDIDSDTFTPEDFSRFGERLEACVRVLDELLARPEFGRQPPSLGAELEVALVDGSARPLPLNEQVLRDTLDDRMTVELDRFDLEANLRHAPLEGRPFEHLRSEIDTARAELNRAAALHGGRIAMIGILPTLTEADIQPSVMTDTVRYRALSRMLRVRRGEPFRLDIRGEDQLQMECRDVTAEGATTSFQVHLAVPLDRFAAVFNAAQLATAPVLAAAGNSPTFLGRRLWDETRVALFKQSVDDRDVMERLTRRPSRVSLGTGWVQSGPAELFREAVHHYPALLPVLSDEDPMAAFEAGQTPELKEIRLHQGTVWHWNRPVYDPSDGGHVRIELRALPSGPTTTDMLANAAFLVGVSLGLAPEMEAVRQSFDFEEAHRNLYRAARSGLDAVLAWPRGLAGVEGGETAAGPLLGRLEPLARAGLREVGVAAEDGDPLIDCFMERVDSGRTGARWQRARLSTLGRDRPGMAALARMLEDYLAHSERGEPVHLWEVG